MMDSFSHADGASLWQRNKNNPRQRCSAPLLKLPLFSPPLSVVAALPFLLAVTVLTATAAQVPPAPLSDPDAPSPHVAGYPDCAHVAAAVQDIQATVAGLAALLLSTQPTVDTSESAAEMLLRNSEQARQGFLQQEQPATLFLSRLLTAAEEGASTLPTSSADNPAVGKLFQPLLAALSPLCTPQPSLNHGPHDLGPLFDGPGYNPPHTESHRHGDLDRGISSHHAVLADAQRQHASTLAGIQELISDPIYPHRPKKVDNGTWRGKAKETTAQAAGTGAGATLSPALQSAGIFPQDDGDMISSNANTHQQHRIRREADERSYSCTFSALQMVFHERQHPTSGNAQQANNGTLFQAACEQINTISNRGATLTLTLDVAHALPDGVIASLNDELEARPFQRVVLSMAVPTWDTLLRGTLSALQWPPALTSLSIEPLAGLDLHDGTLSADALRPFENLQHLTISLNGLLEMDPNILEHMNSLTELTITNTKLATLPVGLFGSNHENITVNLRSNPFTSLPGGLFHSTSLAELSIRGSQLTTLPSTLFGSQPFLHSIEMRFNPLEELPPGLFEECPVLTHIDFSFNKLSKLPPTLLSGTDSLKVVNFNNNRLQSLPEGLFKGVPTVTAVVLSDNYLTQLPSASFFADCPRLSTADFYINELTSIPPLLFAHQTRLEYVDFGQNRLRNVPSNLFTTTQENLTNLYFESNGIASLSPRFFEHTPSLRTLWLKQNELTELHADIFSNLHALRDLLLDSNRLHTLPAGIFDATNLTRLDLSHNLITQIAPGIFSNVRNLRSLQLSSNLGLILHVDALSQLNMLVELGLFRVTLSGNVASVLQRKVGLWSLTHLSIGWTGLHEETLPISTLCDLLYTRVELLSISHTSYKKFGGCSDKSIDTLLMTGNSMLSEVTTFSHKKLNVSSSPALSTLTLGGTAEIADVSGTLLPYSQRFCVEMGSTLFFARNMLNPSAFEPQRLLRQCFLEGLAFDFSNNNNLFANLSVLNGAVSERVVLSGELNPVVRFANSRDTARVRTTVPVFIFDGNAIECRTNFELADVQGLLSSSSEISQSRLPTFSSECGCASGYRRRGDRCVSVRLSREEVAGVVIGSAVVFSLLTLAIQYAMRWFRQRQRERYILLEENELQERLLTKANEDVAALKQGWRINLAEIDLIRKVDEGAFGAVWKGDWEGVAVAVKFLKIASAGLVDPFASSDIEKEVDFLQRTRHPNLVRFFGTGKDVHGAPFLVLEFVDLGSLRHLLFDRGLHAAIQEVRSRDRSLSVSGRYAEVTCNDDDENDAICVDIGRRKATSSTSSMLDSTAPSSFSSWSLGARLRSPALLKLCLVRDIADGMAFLHSLNVMHRDLKSGNVLVNKRLVAKITDFGSMSGKLSKIQRQSAILEGGRKKSSSSSSSGVVEETSLQYYTADDALARTMTAGVGTPLYMPPEMLDPKGSKFSLKADVFSFGVLMWEICECRVPDLIEQELGDAAHKGFVMQTLFRLYNEGRQLTFSRASRNSGSDDNDDDDDNDEPENIEATGEGEGGDSNPHACPQWYQDLSLACMGFSPVERPTFEEIQAMLESKVGEV